VRPFTASFQSMKQLVDNTPRLARMLYLCCHLITIANCIWSIRKNTEHWETDVNKLYPTL